MKQSTTWCYPKTITKTKSSTWKRAKKSLSIGKILPVPNSFKLFRKYRNLVVHAWSDYKTTNLSWFLIHQKITEKEKYFHLYAKILTILTSWSFSSACKVGMKSPTLFKTPWCLFTWQKIQKKNCLKSFIGKIYPLHLSIVKWDHNSGYKLL